MIPDLTIADDAQPIKLAFRPLDGRVESVLPGHAGGVEARALWLAAQLVTGISRAGAEIGLDALTLGEFDAVLAHLQCALFGADLRCEGRCRACDARFEFSVSLPDMQRSLRAEATGVTITDGIATDPQSGRRFRLPLIRDLPRLRTDGAEAWLRGLLVEGPFDAAMEAEVARADPVLSQDVQATCPDCAASAPVRFDIASYLIASLGADAAFFWREVHLLARSYGWSLDEILGLARDDRRRLTGFVVAETGLQRRAS